MPSPETHIPNHEGGDENRGGGVKDSLNLLKRYWLVLFLASCAGDRSEDFERIWDQLKSERISTQEVETVIKERFPDPDWQKRLMKDYGDYNARLDSLLAALPTETIAAYLDGLGVRLNPTAHQLDYRILPIHEPSTFNGRIFRGGLSTRERRTLVLDPTTYALSDTVGFAGNTIHELGHLFERGSEENLPQVIAEGYAEFGTLNFLAYYFRQKGMKKQEIQKQLQQMGFGYQGEMLIVALRASIEGDQNALKDYYEASMDKLAQPFGKMADTSEELNAIVNKRLWGEEGSKTLNTQEVLRVINYFIAEHGYEKCKRAYENLKQDCSIDAAIEDRLGRMKMEEGLTYFDATSLESFNLPLKKEGEYSILIPGGRIITLLYNKTGERGYKKIVEAITHQLKSKELAFDVAIPIHPTMILHENDGSWRKEIKDALMQQN